MSSEKRRKGICITCGNESARTINKYCSNVCQMEYQCLLYLERWKQGEVSGLTSIGTVNSQVKRYLRTKYEDKCCVCDWAKVNPVTRKVPLVADHIDGNWRNNTESNLRLVCPNCDSLSSTYGALNKGNGRKNRAPSKRAQEQRFLAGR